jgi:hypothetical protein
MFLRKLREMRDLLLHRNPGPFENMLNRRDSTFDRGGGNLGGANVHCQSFLGQLR